jgi:hypothetical protein
MVVCKYFDIIFIAGELENNKWIIRFISFFDGPDDLFISTYKNIYPNYSIQIYDNNIKNLRKSIKNEIKFFIEDNINIKEKIRNRKLEKILNS